METVKKIHTDKAPAAVGPYSQAMVINGLVYTGALLKTYTETFNTDRIDNDVKPAKQLGMKSIRIKRGIASSQKALSAEYEADFTIKNLYELDGILDKMQRA